MSHVHREEHIRKLKYQGMEPYQVVEITPQGVVRIATLDGVVM